MRLAAFDLGALRAAQIVFGEAAPGLDDQVETLNTLLFDQHRPVWIVAAQRRRDLEPDQP